MKKRRVPPATIFAWGLVIAVCMAVIPFLHPSQYPQLFFACIATAALHMFEL
jgi:hypothetical protein